MRHQTQGHPIPCYRAVLSLSLPHQIVPELLAFELLQALLDDRGRHGARADELGLMRLNEAGEGILMSSVRPSTPDCLHQ